MLDKKYRGSFRDAYAHVVWTAVFSGLLTEHHGQTFETGLDVNIFG